MPRIRRLQKGYNPIGAIYTKEDNKVKIRFCSRCEEMFQVHARLGPRIMPVLASVLLSAAFLATPTLKVANAQLNETKG